MTRWISVRTGYRFLTALLFAALAGCGLNSDGQDPLVGMWTYSGSPPDPLAITLTFNADKTFTFVEEVAPFSIPAGTVPTPGCATTDTFFGTYAESVSGATNMLTWTYTGGTANTVSGCDDAVMDRGGTPMTDDAITAYIAGGIIPPRTGRYTVTPTTLVLPFSFVSGASTTLTKSPKTRGNI